MLRVDLGLDKGGFRLVQGLFRGGFGLLRVGSGWLRDTLVLVYFGFSVGLGLGKDFLTWCFFSAGCGLGGRGGLVGLGWPSNS